MHRLAVFNGQLRHLRLADDPQPEFLHGAGEPLRQQAFDDVFANLVRELPLDDRLRHLARTEARQLGIALVVARDGAECFGYFLSRSVDDDFARDLGIQHRAMLMFVIVIVFVIVAFVAVSFLGCSRWLVGFESVSGAQFIFAFRARQAPKSTALRAVANGETASCGGIFLNYW